MSDTPMIYGVVPKIIGSVGVVGKNKTNNAPNSGNYKYRSAEDLYNALMPALADHKAFFVPKVISVTEERYENSKGTSMLRKTMKINYRLYAVDGSFVESDVEAEAFDSSDKCTAKCMTAAFKMFASQVFCVAFESVDTEEDHEEVAPQKPEIDDSRVEKVITFLKAKKITEGQILSIIGVDSLKDLSQSKRNELVEYATKINGEKK